MNCFIKVEVNVKTELIAYRISLGARYHNYYLLPIIYYFV